MGCDIHIYLEKRLRKEDAWQADEGHFIYREGDCEYVNRISCSMRDYNLFAIMAGVRGGPALFPVRGIPSDVSELILKAQTSDDHTPSWLTLYEFMKCLRKAGYKDVLKTQKSTELFYNWMDYEWDNRPPPYTPIVNYCKEWIANERAEAMLLNRTDVEPEVRIIFWFDN